MSEIGILLEAPTAVQFCAELRQQEDALEQYVVTAGDLKLLVDGTLEVYRSSGTSVFQVADGAFPGLASLAKIPKPYFVDCDPELRSLSFNHRVQHGALKDQPVQLVLRNGVVIRILNRNLLPAPRAVIVDTVLNAKPEDVRTADVRAFVGGRNGDFNVSLLVPSWHREPRPGDLVAFGVNVSEGQQGAVQIHGAAFRCVCRNGAVQRICDSRHHRLRRPLNDLDRQHRFLNGVASFAREAWQQWRDHAAGLEEMTTYIKSNAC